MPRSRLLILLAWTSTAGCEPPSTGMAVVLNERLFELPSMASAGKGCTTYHLGKGDVGPMTGGGSGNVPGLIVSQRSFGEQVLVQVTEGGRLVAERRYGEPFFLAGKLDEFVVRSASGRAELLRYWGTEGTLRCASFEDDGDSAR